MRTRFRDNSLQLLLVLFIAGFFYAPAISSQHATQITAEHGMVTSSTQYASDIGVQIMKEGGNAIDAAVAVGYALAVTHPAAGNIGGGGFMVLHLDDGSKTAIDYREEAPGKATKTMYQDSAGNVITHLSRVGPKASGVPGVVAGLSYALEKYGTMSRKEVMQPAIDLARDGFIVSDRLAGSLNYHRDYLAKDPVAKKYYVKQDTFRAGDRLELPALANTLQLIAKKGPKAFYRGAIADDIVRTMENLDGLITHKDLENYKVKERQVVHGKYRGYDVYSMPPPSSGGIAVTSILGILEPYPIAKWGHNTAKTVHFKTEAERHVYADRNYFLGDPDYVDMPVDVLTSEIYYRYIRSLISYEATPSSEVDHLSWETVDSLRMYAEHEETTHYSVIDGRGNAVSVTTTLNGSYGAGYAIEGAGFLMNNEMDDFSAKPGVPNMYGLIGAEANSIAPGKRMLSSMSPTIVAKDGEPFLITGSPGGSTIITTTAQIIMNVIDHQMTLGEAVAAPRVHSQWLPDYIFMEAGAISPYDQILLEHAGHRLYVRSAIGEANSVYIAPKTKTRHSGADIQRRGGTTAGY
ncbi:MAG: Glutathione hydrolase proenzyme [Candidatus Marinimicrobia bacterium]|nr:Glutathione hydrolase proenzyme [Candidatus Neomarinimicrobiota bacterium]